MLSLDCGRCLTDGVESITSPKSRQWNKLRSKGGSVTSGAISILPLAHLH